MNTQSNPQKSDIQLQNLAQNENKSILNDLELSEKVFPQTLMSLPKNLQIRVSLNVNENISFLNLDVIPSFLFIDCLNRPVFCFRADGRHFLFDKRINSDKIPNLEDINSVDLEQMLSGSESAYERTRTRNREIPEPEEEGESEETDKGQEGELSNESSSGDNRPLEHTFSIEPLEKFQLM